MLNFHILTLFPEFFESPTQSSIIGRARQQGLLSVEAHNIRDYAENKHNRVDDVPFGGGGGMVMQAGPVVRAIEDAKFDAAKVEALRLAIMEGNYPLDAKRIAENMLDLERMISS